MIVIQMGGHVVVFLGSPLHTSTRLCTALHTLHTSAHRCIPVHTSSESWWGTVGHKGGAQSSFPLQQYWCDSGMYSALATKVGWAGGGGGYGKGRPMLKRALDH